jgi:hypothetical protein
MSATSHSFVIASGSGIAVSTAGIVASKANNSLLNSSVANILNGNFTWYGSDIATIAGISLSFAGIIFGAFQWYRTTSKKVSK